MKRVDIPQCGYQRLAADEFVHFNVFDGTIIALFSRSKKENKTVLLVSHSTSISDEKINEAFRFYVETNGSDHTIEAKLITPNLLVDSVKSKLASLGVTVTKQKKYDATSKLEVYVSGKNAEFKIANLKTLPPKAASTANYKQAISGFAAKKADEPFKVLIVDDSSTIRKILRKTVSSLAGYEVVAETGRPTEVQDLIIKHGPHVMTLDINMPEMTGVELLRKLFPQFYIPTIVVSSINISESTLVLEALELGAVDYLQKPSLDELNILKEQLKIKFDIAVTQQLKRSFSRESGQLKNIVSSSELNMSKVVAIGSSTGGTEAVKCLLSGLPKEIPPILIVQHIPPVFSRAFADRLNSILPFQVLEAKDGDMVEAGKVLIAPGDQHMRIKKSRNQICVHLSKNDGVVNGHMPSVDVMFTSVAEQMKSNAIGIILTGMGADGAKGLLKIKEAGAYTLGQDEQSCVVYGMPKAAQKLGAVDQEVEIEKMADAVITQLQKKGKAA